MVSTRQRYLTICLLGILSAATAQDNSTTTTDAATTAAAETSTAAAAVTTSAASSAETTSSGGSGNVTATTQTVDTTTASMGGGTTQPPGTTATQAAGTTPLPTADFRGRNVKCYTCQNCIEPFDPADSGVTVTQCYGKCEKNYRSANTDTVSGIVVDRSCDDQATDVVCPAPLSLFGWTTVDCYCSTDLCNSGRRIGQSRAFLLLVATWVTTARLL